MNVFKLGIFNVGIIIAASITLVACDKSTNYKLEAVKTCNFPDNPKEPAPLWVCNNTIDGFAISGVGSAPISKAGIQFTTNKAVANARVVLAQEIQTKVSNEIKDYIESKNLGDTEVVTNVSTYITSQISEATLIGSKTLRTVTSSNSVLYALVGLTEESYKATLKETFNKIISQPNLPKKNFLTKTQLKNMEHELISK